MSDGLVLNIMECSHCGISYWFEWPQAKVIDGGPCCFGYDVLGIERYPNKRSALNAYPAWEAARNAAMDAKTAEIKAAA